MNCVFAKCVSASDARNGKLKASPLLFYLFQEIIDSFIILLIKNEASWRSGCSCGSVMNLMFFLDRASL
jgi:hypothetical protein